MRQNHIHGFVNYGLKVQLLISFHKHKANHHFNTCLSLIKQNRLQDFTWITNDLENQPQHMAALQDLASVTWNQHFQLLDEQVSNVSLSKQYLLYGIT